MSAYRWKFGWVGAAIFVAASYPLVLAAGVIDEVKAFQRDTSSLSGDFEQVVTDENGRVLQEGSGTVLLARPGRFRWEYRDPYEQLVVSDGSTVWFYDADLEQVTVKGADSALHGESLLLLSGDITLDQRFSLEVGRSVNGIDWLTARPKRGGGSFSEVRIGFSGRLPARMEFIDSFGQTTTLRFSNLEVNTEVEEGLFRFVAPRGVDVLRSGGG